MKKVDIKKSESMVAVRYQIFFFDQHADRREQISAIEPAFTSPGAVESVIKASKFEGKDYLVLIGAQPQIDELMKEVERLDITDWLDASLEDRKQSIVKLATDLGMTMSDKLREGSDENLVLGDPPEPVTAAKKWKYPRPVQLPSGHEAVWDAVGNATRVKEELMRQASSADAYALHVIVYEDACRRQNIIPWAFASQTELANHALRLKGEIEQRENLAAVILNRVEQHLLDQNLIAKASKQSLDTFQVNPTHGHYEITHKAIWRLDEGQDWKKVEGFILREMGMKYPFRASKNGIVHEVLNPGAADPMFKPVMIPTRIELIPTGKTEVAVYVIQIVTKHQAALLTQETTDDRVQKTMMSMIRRWYSSKGHKFPEPPVRTYGK